jgi:putative restriction endonuclease
MFAIAPTDLGWFADLRDSPTGRVVNFWTPTPWHVKRLQPGDRLYFMLKAPIRKIGGFGSFVGYDDMTAKRAWETYGLGNGVASLDALVAKVNAFAERRSKGYHATSDPLIGCIELADVVTLDDEAFLKPEDVGHSFPRQVVKLKYFSEPDRFAETLGNENQLAPFALVDGEAPRRSSARKDRKGQSFFRQEILRNYGYQCAVLGERIVELLEAAHIQPYVNERSNHPQNGICLRVDLHRLFDEGLLTISSDNHLRVSALLKGTSYETLDGRQISLPSVRHARPSSEAVGAHQRSFRE